ncbi:MAG: hypothetical protein RL375_3925 [Pseudomonadota bacterium]|jgi:hypothetical protein
MTAATKDRDTREVTGRFRSGPMAASTKVYAGTIAVVDASGNVTKGSTATTLKAIGVFDQPYDNTGGAAGAITAEAKRGIFGPFANSSAGDAIAAADVGSTCYIVDDQTVAKTNGSSTRSAAGVVHAVDTEGVWVRFD